MYRINSERTKRLCRELAENADNGDFTLIEKLAPIDRNLSLWMALIRGPIGTPYEG